MTKRKYKKQRLTKTKPKITDKIKYTNNDKNKLLKIRTGESGGLVDYAV